MLQLHLINRTQSCIYAFFFALYARQAASDTSWNDEVNMTQTGAKLQKSASPWRLSTCIVCQTLFHNKPVFEDSLESSCSEGPDTLPVVPQKAVAEVSRIETYRRGWLLWITDGRAKPLMDRKVIDVSSLSLTIYLPTYSSIYLCIYRSIYLSIYISMYLSIYVSIYLSIYLSFFLFIYLSIYLSVYLSTYLSLSLSFICLAVYLSIYLSVFLSIPLFLSLSLAFICLSV